ncbi:MAG: hypothetical protein ABR899_01040 [Candidatus Krumholzibacteriaceae bacterium]|jgi:hypothetical protein
MKHPFYSICLAAVYVALLASRPAAQTTQSHLGLDWQAPRRWVHIDNVDPQKAQLFENSRKTWLAALHRDGRVLGDGRPLFWYARAGTVQTYFTLYPFRLWADLDARSEMIDQTNKIVGEEAVKTYDLGDAALVPPHCSQIWRRLAASDITWSGVDSLTEFTAAVGRLEVHQIDWWHWDEFEHLWNDVKAALVAQKYPLVCRVFTNAFGNNQGEYILLWLAPDPARYQAASTLQKALAQQLGERKGAEDVATLEKLFPLRASYEIEKRLDLSNLGK